MNLSEISRIDLNLLIILRVLLIERHVGRTAARLNLSQPAISHSLKKLRELFDDELFFRTASGISPTRKARELEPHLKLIIGTLENILGQPDSSDPRHFDDEVVVGTTDYISAVFMPHIVSVLQKKAPNVKLRIQFNNVERNVLDLDSELIDFCIAPEQSAVPKRIQCERLYSDRYVIVFRSDHPVLEQSTSLEALRETSRIVATTRNNNSSLLEPQALKLGFSATPSVVVQHFLSIPYMLQNSDCFAFLPALLLKNIDASTNLCVREPDFELPEIRMSLFYNVQRVRSSRCLSWVTELFKAVAEDVKL